MRRIEEGARFIHSGFWLMLLGFLMSVGMVLHYVVGAQYATGHDFMSNITLWFACPWTLSTAVVLGGALCMVVIGAVHTAVARFPGAPDVGSGTTVARWFCAASLVAIFLTGYVGYFAVDAIWPKFYYEPVAQGKNVWLLMQLACIVLFTIGTALAFVDIRRATPARLGCRVAATSSRHRHSAPFRTGSRRWNTASQITRSGNPEPEISCVGPLGIRAACRTELMNIGATPLRKSSGTASDNPNSSHATTYTSFTNRRF